jgi:hypothetical protein
MTVIGRIVADREVRGQYRSDPAAFAGDILGNAP